jgi:hypothetical protein
VIALGRESSLQSFRLAREGNAGKFYGGIGYAPIGIKKVVCADVDPSYQVLLRGRRFIKVDISPLKPFYQ